MCGFVRLKRVHCTPRVVISFFSSGMSRFFARNQLAKVCADTTPSHWGRRADSGEPEGEAANSVLKTVFGVRRRGGGWGSLPEGEKVGGFFSLYQENLYELFVFWDLPCVFMDPDDLIPFPPEGPPTGALLVTQGRRLVTPSRPPPLRVAERDGPKDRSGAPGPIPTVVHGPHCPQPRRLGREG